MLAVIFVELRVIGDADIHCKTPFFKVIGQWRLDLQRLFQYTTIKERGYNMMISKMWDLPDASAEQIRPTSIFIRPLPDMLR